MDGRTGRLLERLPLAQGRPLLGCSLAVVLSAIALGVRWLLADAFPPGFPFLTFFPAVVLSGFLFGRGPGILSAVICGLLSWYLFIPPFGSFALTGGAGIALGFYVGVVAVDLLLIDWMQRGTAQLRRERERSETLAERSRLLFDELQHRVSNNLQMIGAVLSLQQRSVEDPAARQALSEAATKLQTIGRIQRQLYDPSGAFQTLDRMLPELVGDLVAASGKPGVVATVTVDNTIKLPADTIMPIALVVAETIANAVEHGFAGRDGGRITVQLETVAADGVLTIADDGAGPPDGFAVAQASSLGLRIARTLADQMRGKFTLERQDGGGACATLRFPLPAQ
ncbi:two-component sensor histidine kinase [Sphingomonas sp. BE123]|uniref:sensor histidine kinase n=1 Tax=Sphingomonas sp. BE123 TaxID=2817842 RepID=UPI00285D18CC|nr:DUF4118 domain-containing protein [Sphingomonas sp. BE123]MDR6853371.1 two-component sensor histidine kinase [Sphingomonas sp. BE123]